MNCIWFKSLDCGGTWSLLNTHGSSSYVKTMLIARDTAAELIHKAATVTLDNPHITQAIDTWRWPVQNKKKGKEDTVPLCQDCLPGNESFNGNKKYFYGHRMVIFLWKTHYRWTWHCRVGSITRRYIATLSSTLQQVVSVGLSVLMLLLLLLF